MDDNRPCTYTPETHVGRTIPLIVEVHGIFRTRTVREKVAVPPAPEEHHGHSEH